MIYREVGQFKTDYKSDSAVFPILQDRIGIAVIIPNRFHLVAVFDVVHQSRISVSPFGGRSNPFIAVFPQSIYPIFLYPPGKIPRYFQCQLIVIGLQFEPRRIRW